MLAPNYMTAIREETIERCVQRLEKLGCRYCNGHDLPLQLRALKDIAAPTAAAEVGENPSLDDWTRLRKAYTDFTELISENEELEARTIDRCAQVAERYAVNIGEIAHTIAAEIRAMKDKS